jgi:hypothetical protein
MKRIADHHLPRPHDQVSVRQHRNGSSEGVVSSGPLEVKAGQSCYDREQRKGEDNGGASPNFQREAAGSQNAGPTSGPDHQELADSEQRDNTSVSNNAKDDDAHDRDGDHAKREKQEDDSE